MTSINKLRVLVTIEFPGQVHKKALNQLQTIAETEIVDSSKVSDKDELLQIIEHYDGAIITSNIPFDREVIEKAKKMKVVSRLGVGYDKIDVNAAIKHGITVTNAPILSETLVDLIFGLIFAVARNITEANAYIKAGKWKVREERVKFTGIDVFKKTLGIVGLGRVGSLLAQRARGFEMSVIYYDIIRYRELEEKLRLKFLPLHYLLSQADIISINTPLTKTTRGLIGEQEFQRMQKHAILINTSRGPVVDERTLIKALTLGWIAGAGLDVYEKEPIEPHNPLLSLDNVVLTPHIGAWTSECNERVVQIAIENTIRVLQGKKPLFQVRALEL